MSIRLLVVEDNQPFIEILVSMLTQLGPDVSVQVAKSRDSAISLLHDEGFDIILLDLKLPTVDDELDADPEHGRFVLHESRQISRGTPIIVLTGSPAESFIDSFLQYSELIDVWGDRNKLPTIRFLKKSDLDELPKLLQPATEAIRAIRDIEIRTGSEGVILTWEQDRLARIFVRRMGGTSFTVFRISGGLSGATVFRLSVADENGAPVVNAILKIGSPEMVAEEAANYDRYVQRLSEKATPRRLEEIKYGGGGLAAISYRLAADFEKNLFDLARANPELAAAAVERAAELMNPWRDGVGETKTTIREVRRRLVSDEKAGTLATKFGFPWIDAFEQRHVQIRACPIHGDFHGANVLVDEAGVPILIDYGDVGPGPCALDWITLELSTIFHVDGHARNSGWPDEEACIAWSDIARFSRDSNSPEFLQACRGVAEATGVGPRELAACAYAYALRQLSYKDTDKTIALNLINAARAFIEDHT